MVGRLLPANSAKAAASYHLMPVTGKSSCPFGYLPWIQSFGPGRPVASRNIAMASSHERCFSSFRNSTFQYSRFRSEEHTSELQSLTNLVCRLLLEKKKRQNLQSSNDRLLVAGAPAPPRSQTL